MTAIDQRLVRTVRMQQAHLQALLEHPERDESDFHLALSGTLRSMLCDADCPTLLVLADQVGVELKAWGPYPAEYINKRPPSFAFNALVVSPVPELGAHEMDARTFLGAPLGAVSLGEAGPQMQRAWYTARQIIKWAANKDGPAHFDPKRPATMNVIADAMIVTGNIVMISAAGETPISKSDQAPLRIALIQIAQWAESLSKQVLADVPAGT